MQPINIYDSQNVKVTIDENGTPVQVTIAGGPMFVEFYADYASLPNPGQGGILYITEDTNYLYRWDGSYIQVGGSLPEWGDIGGTLSNQTDLQSALDGKVDENSAITGATKTKITYDSKGLVTSGADAGISDITGLQTALDAKVPYTGATGNVNLGEYGATGGYYQFDTSPTTYTQAVGNLGWNDTEGTIEFLLKGGSVDMTIGEKLVARVVNGTGGNVLKSNYQVVKVTGAQGQRLQVNLAQGNNDANSTDTLGLIAENISNNQSGFIVTSGLIEEVNTSGSLQSESWSDGDILYLSPITAGKVTNIKPQAPNHSVIVGFVVYAHSVHGKIFVKVDNGYELDELHNVKINTGTLSNGQVLKYNSTLGVWENNTDAAGTGTVTSIATSSPLTGGTITTSGTIGITQATTSASGYLSSTDWNLFNGKQNALTNPVTGTGTTNELTYFSGTSAISSLSTATYPSLTELSYVKGVTSSIQTQLNGKQATLTNPITGTGTSGQIGYFNGTTSLTSSSNLFWDATNNRLGIGTSSPSNDLHISKSTTGSLLVETSTTSSIATVSVKTGTIGGLFRAYGSTFSVASLANKTGFGPDGATGLVIFTNANSADGGTGSLSIRGGGYDSTAEVLYIDKDGSTFSKAATFSKTVTLSNNQNNVTYWSASNTTSGTAAQVQYYLLSDSSSGAAALAKYSSGYTTYKLLSAKNLVVYNDATGGDIGILNDYASGNIKLAAGGSSTAQATLFSTGNLAIGTTTDSGYKLDVNGTARVQGALTATGSITASSAIARGTYLNQTLVAAANNDVLVGLDINPTFTNGAYTGVTNYAARIQGALITTGSITAVSNNAFGTYLNQTLVASANNDTLVGLRIQPTFNNGSYAGTGNYALVATGKGSFSDQFSVASSTLNSYYKLGVNGNFGVGGILVLSSDITGSGTPIYLERTASLFNVFSTLTTTFSVGSEAMRIFSSSKNIAINTTTDSGYKLDVNGTVRSQGDLTISDAKNIILDTTTGTKIGTTTSQKISFWNATPIVQPTTAVAAATLTGGGGTALTDTDTFDGYTLKQIVKALRNTGLLA